MSQKTIFTRIVNKHDTIANWNSSELLLKDGEIALAYVETHEADGSIVPTYLMKVGHGNKKFSELKWLAAPASDVHAWAKQASLSDVSEFSNLSSTVGTNTGNISTLTTKVAAIEKLTGTTGVADQIKAAIEALDVTDAAVEKQFVTAVSETDGKISVTRRALSADDIPQITSAKISDFETAVNALIAVETANRQSADTALGNRITELETFKNTTVPNTYATIEALNGVKTTAEAAVTDADLATALEPYAKSADVEEDITEAKTQVQGALIGTAGDASSANTVYGAKKYAEEKASAAQNAAADDATTKAGQALTDAKAYTDTRETAITTAYKKYADDAQAAAEDYADGLIAAEITRADKAYDEAGAAAKALTDAKAYTDEVKADILGEGALVETYDTLKEIGDWISSTGVDATELTTAIAGEAKAREEADEALEAKITALQGTDHTHSNKELLDTYTQTEANLADAVSKKHSHANNAELDKIADGDVAKWNAAEQNAKDYAKGLVEGHESAVNTKFTEYSTTEQMNSAITTEIGKLDVTVTGMSAGKTVASLTEVDGKIAATFQDISITESQISDLKSYETVANVESKIADAKTALQGGASDTADSATIAGAKKYADAKAAAAESAAKTAAATDATNKANTAKSEAIAAAATDASTKADTAEANAKTYTNTEIGKVNKTISELTMDDIGSGTNAVVWVLDCGTSATVID